MALEITPEEYNSTRLPFDDTLIALCPFPLRLTSKDFYIKLRKTFHRNYLRRNHRDHFRRLWTAISQNSRVKNESSTQYNSVPPVNKGQSSINIDIHSFEEYVEENLGSCIQRVNNTLNKYLGHETLLNMTNFMFRKRCEMGDFYQNTGSLLSVMHPVKFGKENLWTYILSPLMIWEYLESKDNLDEKCIKERGEDKIDEALTMKNY